MIKLSRIESKISSLLLKVVQDLKTTKNQSVTVRIAGGWVRDKILGIESKDLDFALDSMTGYEFAKQVELYLNKNRGQSEGRVGDLDDYTFIASTPAKIESNPDKSKHLETATMRLYGLFIDFVNLRTEVYLEDSRVPEMV